MKFSLNLLGTFLDKGMPLIIGVLLSNYMSSETFGTWSLYYQFLLIVNLIATSPVLGFFGRYFFQPTYVDKGVMIIYNYVVVFSILLISFIIFYSFFQSFTAVSILEILSLIGFTSYIYYTLYLRFIKEDFKYVISAFLRIIILSSIILIGYLINQDISYELLILAFSLSHSLSLFQAFKRYKLEKKYANIEMKEFLSLSMYGISSSTVNGSDKFIIFALGNSKAFLGVYSYFFTLASAPNLLVEAFKKIYTPIQFKEYAENGKLSSKTVRGIVYFLIGFSILQFAGPIILYKILVYLNLVNTDYLATDNVEYLLLLFSFGLYGFSIYHFINPYLIYFKKTIFMTGSLILAFIIYLLFLYFGNETGNLFYLAICKSIMLVGATTITFLVAKTLLPKDKLN
jgi:O-antigen/teichoic acid export membrane protein